MAKADEESEETEQERRKRVQKETLAKLRQSKAGPTEVAGATRSQEYNLERAEGGGTTAGYRTRMERVEKAAPTGPGFTAGQVKAQPGGGMPTQENWRDHFPEASSFFDAMRLWRDKERESAAPQKQAFKAAAQK